MPKTRGTWIVRKFKRGFSEKEGTVDTPMHTMSRGQERKGPVAPPKKLKMNVFGQTIDTVQAKINHTNFICS